MAITYKNQDDQTRLMNISVNACNVGNINCGIFVDGLATTSAQQSPFIPLVETDKGVKSITSVQLTASTGGFATLVLVKPITRLILREQSTATEINSLVHRPSIPRVYDGAYLNFIYKSGQAAASGIVRGQIDFVWG